ncbi:hypothetical protein MHM88_09915 [Epibacterium sp. MM17-32]|uniref:hypothetical protein n=1 Tax=Epibacterium sp. MM17-32 TaxID=2917734 RepID=UPI001EF71160|nr:hypothetical protein [Epibacterium sp. MM17-32]MCG7628122.1 hypothetical protein [Epibacterium sp. MM17-32]
MKPLTSLPAVALGTGIAATAVSDAPLRNATVPDLSPERLVEIATDILTLAD